MNLAFKSRHNSRTLSLRTVTALVPVLGLAASFNSPVQADPPANTGSWTNVFTDDFNSLNYSTWSNGYPEWGNGFHNSQHRFEGYMPDAHEGKPTFNSGKNVWTSNGNLVIQARQEANLGGGKWTTGYINSATKKAFRYGYFEIRAKFSSSQGQDPGFWLYPNQYGWPPEIDVVEIPGRGNGNEAQVNIHRRADGNNTGPWTNFSSSINSPLSVTVDPNIYHTYACLWDPGKMVFYVDGKEVHRVVGSSPQVDMAMNIAHEIKRDGGGFYGNPDLGVYPATQYIDYVKVWSHVGGATVPQLDEVDLTNIAGCQFSALGENPPNEVVGEAFDNDIYSKWLHKSGSSSRASWVKMLLPSGQKRVASRLRLTASAGAHERDPRNITIFGVKDDNSLQNLGSHVVPTSYDYKRQTIDFNNNSPFKGYVLNIDSVQNTSTADSVQIAEIEWIQRGPDYIVNNAIYEIEALGGDSLASGSVLDTNGGANLAAVRVLGRVAGRSEQRWRTEQQSDGSFELIPQNATGQRLDVNAQGGSGSKIQLYSDVSSPAQRWRLTRQSDSTYKLTTSYNSGLVVQNNGSAQATTATSGSATNQRWLFNAR